MLPAKPKCGVGVLVGLEDGEEQPEADRQPQAPLHLLPVVLLDQRVVRPGRGAARAEQDQRVDQRQVPGIEGLDPRRRPDAGDDLDALDHRPSGRGRA